MKTNERTIISEIKYFLIRKLKSKAGIVQVKSKQTKKIERLRDHLGKCSVINAQPFRLNRVVFTKCQITSRNLINLTRNKAKKGLALFYVKSVL